MFGMGFGLTDGRPESRNSVDTYLAGLETRSAWTWGAVTIVLFAVAAWGALRLAWVVLPAG